MSVELHRDAQWIARDLGITVDEMIAGHVAYLREKYAIGFITLEELETGLDNVLIGGPINVPRAAGFDIRRGVAARPGVLA